MRVRVGWACVCAKLTPPKGRLRKAVVRIAALEQGRVGRHVHVRVVAGAVLQGAWRAGQRRRVCPRRQGCGGGGRRARSDAGVVGPVDGSGRPRPEGRHCPGVRRRRVAAAGRARVAARVGESVLLQTAKVILLASGADNDREGVPGYGIGVCLIFFLFSYFFFLSLFEMDF